MIAYSEYVLQPDSILWGVFLPVLTQFVLLKRVNVYSNNKCPMQKSDLDQIGKLVRKIVREEVKTEVKDSTRTVENQIRLSRMQVQSEINELDDRMKNVEIRVENVGSKADKLDKRLSAMDKNIKYIRKTVKIIAKNYDEGDVKLGKRVTRIEEHLNIPQI